MAERIKIITLGAATFDTFLMGEVLAAKRDVRSHDYVEQFPLGQKLPIEQVVFSVGGNSANAAVTFARQGFATSFVGKIADDLPGNEILQTLKNENINTSQMLCDLDGMTSFSTILLAPSGERTILTYHGVSHQLTLADVNLSKLGGADWLYLSALPSDLKLLAAILKLARSTGIKVAYNPGSSELSVSSKLKSLLVDLAVLIGNKEELAKLFGAGSAADIIKTAAGACPYVILTDGPRGAWATDGALIYELGLYRQVKVIDRTGAGDAFGAGVVARLAAGAKLEAALVFGAANATSVAQVVGSQAGILYKSAKLGHMAIKTRPLQA